MEDVVDSFLEVTDEGSYLWTWSSVEADDCVDWVGLLWSVVDLYYSRGNLGGSSWEDGDVKAVVVVDTDVFFV